MSKISKNSETMEQIESQEDSTNIAANPSPLEQGTIVESTSVEGLRKSKRSGQSFEKIRERLKEISTLSNNNSSLIESISAYRSQKKKFLDWKQSGRIPERIKCYRSSERKTSNTLVDLIPTAVSGYCLSDQRDGEELVFWYADKKDKDQFLLYKHKVDFCEKLRTKGYKGIVKDVSPSFAIGLNYTKKNHNNFDISVHNGDPKSVRFWVDRQLRIDSFEQQYGQDTVRALIYRASRLLSKNRQRIKSKAIEAFDWLSDSVQFPIYSIQNSIRSILIEQRAMILILVSCLLLTLFVSRNPGLFYGVPISSDMINEPEQTETKLARIPELEPDFKESRLPVFNNSGIEQRSGEGIRKGKEKLRQGILETAGLPDRAVQNRNPSTFDYEMTQISIDFALREQKLSISELTDDNGLGLNFGVKDITPIDNAFLKEEDRPVKLDANSILIRPQ